MVTFNKTKGEMSVGQKFGKLTVLSFSHIGQDVVCRCDCGSIIHTRVSTIVRLGKSAVTQCEKCKREEKPKPPSRRQKSWFKDRPEKLKAIKERKKAGVLLTPNRVDSAKAYIQLREKGKVSQDTKPEEYLNYISKNKKEEQV